MSWTLTDLPWLVPVPPDFRQRCRAICPDEEAAGIAIAELARYRMSSNDLFSLGRIVETAIASGRSLDGLTPLTLGILANGTTKLWSATLAATAARHSIALRVISGEYDQALQESVDPKSEVNVSRPDVVLVALDHRGLPWEPVAPGSDRATETVLEQIQAYYLAVRDGLSENGNATVIWQTLACPPEPLFGHLDGHIEGTTRHIINELNRWISAECRRRGDCLLDLVALAEQVGTVEWFDPVQWNLHKVPFSQRIVPLYADHVGRILGALRGRARKCLVVDLDYTLWGGAIGDDGLEGIRIAAGSGEGEAYLDVQRYVLALRSRGVILAVVSKNDENDAKLPFHNHPDMILRESHFAAFIANWTDKASNIQAIAHQLNIGLDALVLLDDNPLERAQVRAALPAVAVPELPDDPSYFVRTLASAGYFESIRFSAEDSRRADDYAANSLRRSAAAEARDIGEFLRQLEMVATVSPFNAIGRPRIAQLINRSNQFNLTTRRYTEAQIAAMEQDLTAYTLQLRLRDRFGDTGIISAVICRRLGKVWEIDTWIMSCRVLGRRVEELVLDEIVQAARDDGAESIKGRFIPTRKNGLVRDHYQRLGFRPYGTEGDETIWILDLQGYLSPNIPFRIERASKTDSDVMSRKGADRQMASTNAGQSGPAGKL